jgi:predicted component of type VI protein secretion system
MEAVLIGPQGRTALGPTPVKIGRAPDNQIALANDLKASRHHAEIRPMGNGYCIVDVGSTSGTFVDEQPILPQKPHQLYPQNSIRIGDTTFTYEMVELQIPPTVFVGKAAEIPPTVAADPPILKTVFAPQPFPDAQQVPDYPQLPPLPERNRGANKKAGKAKQQPKDNQRNQQPQVKKKGRGGLWITAVVLVLFLAVLIGGGVFAYNVLIPHSTPQQTLTTFCTDLKNGDYPSAYQQLSTEDQSTMTEAQFAQKVSGAIAQGGGLKDCTVEAGSVGIDPNNNARAHGRLLYTVAALPKPLPSPMQLVLENNTWKIINLRMPSAG